MWSTTSSVMYGWKVNSVVTFEISFLAYSCVIFIDISVQHLDIHVMKSFDKKCGILMFETFIVECFLVVPSCCFY